MPCKWLEKRPWNHPRHRLSWQAPQVCFFIIVPFPECKPFQSFWFFLDFYKSHLAPPTTTKDLPTNAAEETQNIHRAAPGSRNPWQRCQELHAWRPSPWQPRKLNLISTLPSTHLNLSKVDQLDIIPKPCDFGWKAYVSYSLSLSISVSKSSAKG